MIGAAVLAGLAAQAAAAQAQPYHALGSDPAWSLTISGGRITFVSPGRTDLVVTAPAPQNDDDGITNYRADGLSISIIPLPCDPVGGQRYAHSVFVTIGREQFSGCGGRALAADSLDGTSWLIAEIAGERTELTGDVLRDDRYAVDFGAERLVGYGGCNRFSGSYSRAGNTVTFGPLMSTRRACPEPTMGRERRLFEILSAPVTVSFPDRQSLLLTGQRGVIRLRRTG